MARADAACGKEFKDGIKNIMEEITCSICDEDRPLLLLPCQHRFCKVCVGEHITVRYGA